MLRDTKTKVASVTEVLLAEFVFLDFETALEDFFGFRATDGDVNRDLLVTTDTEGSDGVSCFD